LEIIPGEKYLGAKQVRTSFPFAWVALDKNAGWAGGEPQTLISRRQGFPHMHWLMQVSLWLPGHLRHPGGTIPAQRPNPWLDGRTGRNRNKWEGLASTYFWAKVPGFLQGGAPISDGVRGVPCQPNHIWGASDTA